MILRTFSVFFFLKAEQRLEMLWVSGGPDNRAALETGNY